MIELFVKRPAMTVMFVLVFVVLGLVSFVNLQIERTPKIDLPLVSIKTIYPGASPIEIETQMIKKIEDVVAEISGIKKIVSYAYENYGSILIEFNIDSDINIKSIEIKDKVEAILNEFPSGAKKPEIAKFDPLVEPILDLVLESTKHDARDLYEYADKKLRSRLSIIEGVASIEIVGGKVRQINIAADPYLMKKYFISINEVLQAIGSKNINIPSGNIERKENTISVRFVGEYNNLEDIANTVVVSRDGEKLKIKDVAKVGDTSRKVETISKFNGKDAVSLSIKKLSDGDAVSIAKNIRKELLSIAEEIPNGMTLSVATDKTTSIVDENYSTIYNIIIGIFLTVLVLFIFMGDLRTTVVASLVIPTSLISALFLMDFSNFSINMMSLLAIATSLGTLIANSLIIIENVITHIQEKGEDAVTASINGTKEVTIAILASAGTNLVVFTPIAFMGGIVGQFMKQFGLTVVFVTLFSILASFSLTPMLCSKILARKSSGKSILSKLSIIISNTVNRILDYIMVKYKTVFNIILEFKITTLAVVSIFILLSLIPISYLGSEFFSPYDSDFINIKIETPQGSSIEKTLNIVNDIEEMLKDYPEVKNYLSYIGQSSYEKANISINLIPSKTRKKSDNDIINELIVKTSKIPSATISLERQNMGDNNGGDVNVDIYGLNYDELIKLSLKMKESMLETGFFRSIESSYKTPKKELQFIPNENKIVYYGLENAKVGSIIRTSVNGNDDNIFKELGEEYKINIELNPAYKQNLDDISKINVISKDGLLSISDLGKIESEDASPSLYRRDKQRVIQLFGYLAKSDSGTVQKILNNEFKKIGLQEGYFYKYSGNSEMFSESIIEIAKAFILAIILTYMLLVAVLNSFTLPFVIATSILTSFITAILMELFLEHSINIGTLMSIVMLVGLVVNNAILMVDYAMQKIAQGTNVREAIWLGAKDKFRTILMTSFAIILGAVPQLFDKMTFKASIASILIGGILGSIVFTYIIIPVFFELNFKFFKKSKKTV